MIGIAAALAYFTIYKAPLGGSVTLFSMVPIIIIALRHGPLWGFACAFVFSCIELLYGLGNFAWIPTTRGVVLSVLLDYIAAFTVLGFAGFFKPALDGNQSRGRKITVASLAAVSVCILRYIIHVIVGFVVWYELTKTWYPGPGEIEPGDTLHYVHTVGGWLYSVVYNLHYMLPETIITVVAAQAVVTILSIVGKNRKPAGE